MDRNRALDELSTPHMGDTVTHLSTFNSHWSKAVANHATAPFLLFRDDAGTTTYTYAQFDDIVARTAGTLRNNGVRSGASIHVVLRNCPGFLAIWLAASRLGAWFVPVDPASSPRDIRSQARRTKPAIGVCAAARSEVYRSGAEGLVPTVLQLTENSSDVAFNGPLVSGDPVASDELTVVAEDRLAVMFTSGTTSEPKGVVLTQENYSTVARTMSSAVGLQSNHRWLVTLPLFHANAQYYCFAPAIAVGASVALTHTFSASRWVRQAHDLGVTHASLFAAPIRMILARSGQDLPRLSLNHVWFAQSLGHEHYEQFAAITGCRPRQLYGMTETVAAVTGDDSEPARHDVIGLPLGDRRIEIVDPMTGEPTIPGSSGMLLVHGTRGGDLFAGYLDDPETTASSFAGHSDGTVWFRTGDLVSADPDNGSLRFVGRFDDVIKVSGENVSLTQVESVIAQGPGVLEAAVLAQPDPMRDQVPVAYVVAKDRTSPPDLTALEAWAIENLPPAARPREWHLIDELPRTSVGKIRRFRIPSKAAGTAE